MNRTISIPGEPFPALSVGSVEGRRRSRREHSREKGESYPNYSWNKNDFAYSNGVVFES